MTESTASTEPSAEALENYDDTKRGDWEDFAIRKAKVAMLPTTLKRVYQTGAIA